MLKRLIGGKQVKKIVLKFGGSSVSNVEKMNQVAKVIQKKRELYDQIVVVVSAMGKSTNDFISLANEIAAIPSKREMDVLLTAGEQISMALLAIAIQEKGLDSISLTGWQAGFKTWGIHGKNKIDSVDISRVEEELSKNKVVIVAGFQGLNEASDLTTLGRGGSDTSAVALAVKLDCPCEIFTDVDGIYSIDPRLHPKAKKIDQLSYEETMEMANLGANIIEPRSVELAMRFNIPITIALNTGDIEGTMITKEQEMMEKNTITSVSIVDDVALIIIEDLGTNSTLIADLFTRLAEEGINVDVISQSLQNDVAFTVSRQDIPTIKELLSEFNNPVAHIKNDVVKVSVIGNAMRNQPGVAARIFKVFAKDNIHFYQVSTSEISISYIVDEINTEAIVRALAEELDL